MDSFDSVPFAFSDAAAGWVFANGFDMEDVYAGLLGPHFKQVSPIASGHGQGRYIHYVKVNERPCKIITASGDMRYEDDTQVVISFLPLDSGWAS